MLYLGDTNYKGTDFLFGFDGERLELVPRPGEWDKAQALEPGFCQNGVRYFTGEGAPIESDYFELSPSNAPEKLVVFPESDAFAPEPMLFRSLRVGARAFFELDRRLPVVGLRLHSPHLSKCYDDKAALDMRCEREVARFSVSTKRPKPLSCDFTFEGRPVRATLFYIEKMRHGSGEPPLTVESALDLSFGAEDDFSFVFDLAMVARDFLAFCLQASGAEFDAVEVLVEKPANDWYRERTGKDRVVSPGGSLTLSKRPVGCAGEVKYHIPLGIVDGFEGTLFQKIADGKLSLRHLPSPGRVGVWDDARIILLAASFDQEATLLYPEGIPHKESTMEARSIVVGTLGKAEGEARNKKIRKKVIKLVKRLTRVAEEGDPFSSRMVQVYKDHSSLIEGLCPCLDSKESFTELAERIQALRNSLAHGHLEVAYGDSIVDDVLALEKVVLAIQMLRLGLKDEDVARMVDIARRR